MLARLMSSSRHFQMDSELSHPLDSVALTTPSGNIAGTTSAGIKRYGLGARDFPAPTPWLM